MTQIVPGFADLHIEERSKGEWLVSADGRHLVAGSEMLAIIRALSDSPDEETSFARYVASGGRLSAEAFSAHAARCRSVFAAGEGARDRSVRMRFGLIEAGRVRSLVPRLHFLFRWPGAVLGIAAALVSVGFAIAGFHWSQVVDCSISSISFPELLLGFVVVLLGGVCHELGHAAALSRFRHDPGAIGLGLYAGVLPVFFADLSAAWRLPVGQRIVVNLGGIYLQLIFATMVIALSSIHKSDFLLAAGLSSAVLALFQLVPVARSDGFWILADLVDEPRLGQYRASLWSDAGKASKAGKSARRRLSYQAGNALFVGALSWLAFGRATSFGADLLVYVRTGFAAESLNSPASFLTFVIFVLLAVRIGSSLGRLLLASLVRRGQRPMDKA
jgi:hypothetical protein